MANYRRSKSLLPNAYHTTFKGKHQRNLHLIFSSMKIDQFITFPFIFTIFLLLFMLVKHSRKPKTQNTTLRLPPGPSKLPLIGHLHHLLGPLPHRALKVLAEVHGPIMYLKLGEISAVVISSPSVAKQMMTTHDLKFVHRPQNLSSKIISYNGRDLIMAPYGEYGRQLKKICILELLSAKRVQSFWAVRLEEVTNFIGRISLVAGSPMNLSENIFTLINDITARITFGKKCKDKEAFISIVTEVLRLASGFGVADLYPSLKFLEVISGDRSKLERMHRKVDEMLNDIIEEHREKRMTLDAIKVEEVDEDIVDVLLRLQEGDKFEVPFSIENVKAITLDMFSAGTNSSSTAIEWTFSELLKNPRVMKKAQAEVRQVFNIEKAINDADMNELHYLRLVIKEALRLHPPAPLLLPRECTETFEIEGYVIPQGSKVMVNAWAIGRDPQHWNDPESFEPERFQDVSIDFRGTNFEFIPFGAGRRICPAISFGIANVELPLALLLYHFDWKLPDGVKPEELDMTEGLSSVVRIKNNLHVIPTPCIT